MNIRLLTIAIVALACALTPSGAKDSDLGFAAKKPVLSAACPTCPWGALGEVVKKALAAEGYDVQICYNCFGADNPRIVSGAKLPPPLTPQLKAFGIPEPPKGRADFGITALHILDWAYNGTYTYKSDGPMRNLRVIAVIQEPAYVLVAVKSSSGITDLSDIGKKHLGVRILTQSADNPLIQPILSYYGIDEAKLKSWGGAFEPSLNPASRANFDVIISSTALLANNPESNEWYEASQKYDLTYLPLPEPVLATLEKTFAMERVDVPIGYMRGINKPIPTVARSGEVIYARADAPDDFAYATAKAMDENKHLLEWALVPLSYDPARVWKALDVPLHPGAARYYREAGYMK